jgi:hypothetical protein
LAKQSQDDLVQEANKAATQVIADSGESELVCAMATWLTFEADKRQGESEASAQRRVEAEARRRWPQSKPDDFERAQALSGKALELSNAMLERRVEGHELH